ncbi:hypothetical protein [Mesorhizobium japonicum]|uniref:hypothetical protein n=1 Tax=Mesorhizobium japonicum TaxID=2066070 RepID=UPI0003255411|nr:hypothetical protein [Mesorhizobium japonicum]
MLIIYPQPDSPEATKRALWLDFIDPDTAEVKEVEGLAGVALPSRENLSEIESSSRLKARDGVLTMSVPIVTQVEGGRRWLLPSASCCRAAA